MMDRNRERMVWQRVYGGPEGRQRRPNRKEMTQCYRRELADFAYYDRFRDDPIYGGAFSRLADDAQTHCKMLKQILER